MSRPRGATRSRGLDVAIYGVGPLLVLIAAVWSVRQQDRWDAENRRLAQVPLDGVSRMEARRSGGPEPEGAPLLPDFPSREDEGACPPGNPEERCAPTRAAARFYPPEDAAAGRAWIQAEGESFGLALPPARSLQVVSWYAGVDPATLTVVELRVLAAAQATLLGAPPGGDQSVQRLLSGLEDLRVAAEPYGASLPARVLPTYSRGEVPPSIDLGAEVLARTTTEAAANATDPVPPFAGYAATIRRGEAPPAEAWRAPGVAGLLALEVLRAERSSLIPMVCAMVADPPTVADQLAGLWALRPWMLSVVSLPAGCEAAKAQLAMFEAASR